jgi:hypothetical protein
VSWYPADSDDARELRDRADDGHADHDCADGWLLDEDAEGRPRPCPTCKPHVARFRRRLRDQMYGQRVHSARKLRSFELVFDDAERT